MRLLNLLAAGLLALSALQISTTPAIAQDDGIIKVTTEETSESVFRARRDCDLRDHGLVDCT